VAPVERQVPSCLPEGIKGDIPLFSADAEENGRSRFSLELSGLIGVAVLRSRAKLAEKPLESLDDPKQKEIDRLWAEEAEDRIDAS